MNDATRRSTIRFLSGTVIASVGAPYHSVRWMRSTRPKAPVFAKIWLVLCGVSVLLGVWRVVGYRNRRDSFAEEMHRRHSSANDRGQAVVGLGPLVFCVVHFWSPWGGRGLILDVLLCGLAAWALWQYLFREQRRSAWSLGFAYTLLAVVAVARFLYRHDIQPGHRGYPESDSRKFELGAKG